MAAEAKSIAGDSHGAPETAEEEEHAAVEKAEVEMAAERDESEEAGEAMETGRTSTDDAETE